MATGQNDSSLLTGDIGRPISAVLSLAESVVSRTETESEGRAVSRTDDDSPGASTTDRPNDREVEPLVPPRERLLGLLERSGGRMKQSDIVEVVEWSESTVSRKLGELETAGAITRYRIGRGKIVFLPGAEPDCVGSPFDRGEDEEKRPIAA